jgi:hypothetical protein
MSKVGVTGFGGLGGVGDLCFKKFFLPHQSSSHIVAYSPSSITGGL